MFSWMYPSHFCHFWTFLLLNLKPVCILKKIVTMNVAETSRKFFYLSNIRKNATFIENNFFPEMARLWTFFPNPKWFQLFVYFFGKKKNFLRKATPTHFMFSWMYPSHFCHFWTFLLLNLKPLFARLWGQLQPKLWGYTFCFSDIVLSMAISPHKHKLKSQSGGIVP